MDCCRDFDKGFDMD
jgi:hypothetical protein